ncbi:MAG: hypothetical protein GF333_03195 [Candidatus Omnitrophica bacterium]|nr:hypothetical protein [Candidatus Omnitrophota bacterium]
MERIVGYPSRDVDKKFRRAVRTVRKTLREITRPDVRRVCASFFLGVFLTGTVAAVVWLVRSSVYAQSTMVRSAAVPLESVRWVMSGSLASALISFARVKYRLGKRCFDVAASAIGLILSAPLLIIIAILVKLESEGPVFFTQKRLGKNGKIFNIWKFRTMRNNAEMETGPVWAQDDDPRVTRLGNFLRKTHIDELPQLWNVVRGDMSLIGPRPERPEFSEQIAFHVPQFRQRIEVKPGITGLAQVRYQYGASIRDASRKLRYDQLYLQRMCWFLDFQILLWTLGRVMTGEGAR